MSADAMRFSALSFRPVLFLSNAGLGKCAPLGTGKFWANKETAMTNFIGSLAQSEAAMEVFRAQGTGHFVMISSMSAMRGMPKAMATYAATKAGVAHLARSEEHTSELQSLMRLSYAVF